MNNIIITNRRRAVYAAAALTVHGRQKDLIGESPKTRAKDLITDLCHYLRSTLGMSVDDVGETLDAACTAFNVEVQTDADG